MVGFGVACDLILANEVSVEVSFSACGRFYDSKDKDTKRQSFFLLECVLCLDVMTGTVTARETCLRGEPKMMGVSERRDGKNLHHT